MNRFRAAGAVLIMLLVAACAPAASPDGSEPVETPTPTPVVTPEPDPSIDLGEGGPSFVPGAGALADLLPTEVGGLTLEYQYAAGQGLFDAEGVTPEVEAFLNRLGADVDDIQFGFGFAFDAEAGGGLSVLAIRVIGADEGTLRTEFVTVMQTEDPDTTTEEMNLGGKNVTAMTLSDDTEPSSYLYVKGDVVFMVGGEPLTLVEDALSQLP